MNEYKTEHLHWASRSPKDIVENIHLKSHSVNPFPHNPSLTPSTIKKSTFTLFYVSAMD